MSLALTVNASGLPGAGFFPVLAASAAKAGLAASKTNEIVAANVFIGGLLLGMAAKLITRSDTGTPCARATGSRSHDTGCDSGGGSAARATSGRRERLVGFHARRQRLQHRLLGFLEVMGGDVHHVERRVLGALGMGL